MAMASRIPGSKVPASPAISSTLAPPKPKKEIIKTASGVARLRGKEVLCFSPLEASSAKTRSSGLANESLKLKRLELSQKIDHPRSHPCPPPRLEVISDHFPANLLGLFKEILLDYVHQEVTRKWVLIFLRVLLLILAKDTIVGFGLV